MAFFKADVKCYHCGRVSGTVTGPQGAPIRHCSFTPRGSTSPAEGLAGRIACTHCAGPVFLDEIEVIAARPLQQISRKERRSVA